MIVYVKLREDVFSFVKAILGYLKESRKLRETFYQVPVPLTAYVIRNCERQHEAAQNGREEDKVDISITINRISAQPNKYEARNIPFSLLEITKPILAYQRVTTTKASTSTRRSIAGEALRVSVVNSFELRVTEVWLHNNCRLDIDGSAIKTMAHLNLITILLNVCLIWL
jgi:hypothetical protein